MMDFLHLTLCDEEDKGGVEWVLLQLPQEKEEPATMEGAESQPNPIPDFMERFRETSPGSNRRGKYIPRGLTY